MANVSNKTNGQAEAFDAAYKVAELLGKSIQIADFSIKHPTLDANTSAEKPTPEVFRWLKSDDPDVDQLLAQIDSLYSTGVQSFLRPSALYDMFELAAGEFSVALPKGFPNVLMYSADKERIAVAWAFTRIVFILFCTDDTYHILSCTEPAIREQEYNYQPFSEKAKDFLTKVCKSYIKNYPTPHVHYAEESLKKAVSSGDTPVPDGIGNLSPLGGFPNGDPLNWLFKILSSKHRRLPVSSKSNRHENISIQRYKDSIRFIKTNRLSGSEITIEIEDAEEFLKKCNKPFLKSMVFVLQKMTEQNFPAVVGFDLQEMVDLKMYSSTANAWRAMKDFVPQSNKIIFDGSFKKGRKVVSAQRGVLFYNISMNNGYVSIFVNKEFNMEFIAPYFTIFPRFAYGLNYNAFRMVQYIFFLARQNTKPIKEKGSFSINLDSIRDALGLPDPDDVLNRKYRQYIIGPIEAAIEEIEIAMEQAPEARDCQFTITPVVADDVSIRKWLEGYFVIGLKDDFARTFVDLAEKAETQRERWDRAKNTELAKIAAQNELKED